MMEKKNYLSVRIKWCALLAAGLIGAFLVRMWVVCIREMQSLMVPAVFTALSAALAVIVYRTVLIPYRETRKIYEQFVMGYVMEDLFKVRYPFSPESEQAVLRLNEIIDRNNLIAISKKQAEYLALQNQINPHFLYNTLDSVVWMTENGRTQEAVVMLTALARFFRISLSKGSNIIPIGDEIEHARNYLTIQKMRYKNKFSADISVEPGVEKLYTIKLIIQPILENAIYHGMEYADGDGEIHIRAFREGETVVIEVEDNGPGMSEEIVEQLLKPTRDVSVPKAKGSGIGFRNVHQRIQLTFGSAYGLTIRSEPDNGTVVRICLPVLEEEDARKYRKEGER